MRHVLAGQRHGFAGLRVPALPRRPEVQREAAEPADLDALTLRERVAQGKCDVLGSAQTLTWSLLGMFRSTLE